MINYSEVGKRIRYYRIKEGLTQEQLAFDIETSASFLSNIERGVKKPSLQKVAQIAEILGVTVEDLISPGHAPPDNSLANLEKLVILCSRADRDRLLNKRNTTLTAPAYKRRLIPLYFHDKILNIIIVFYQRVRKKTRR